MPKEPVRVRANKATTANVRITTIISAPGYAILKACEGPKFDLKIHALSLELGKAAGRIPTEEGRTIQGLRYWYQMGTVRKDRYAVASEQGGCPNGH